MKTTAKAVFSAKQAFRTTPGVRFMIFGSLLFSMGAASIKLAGPYFPASQILFVRAVVGIILCLWMTRKAGVPALGYQKPLLFLRGVTGALSFFAITYAYMHLPLADASVIIFLHPVLVAILAAVILKEQMPRQSWICILSSLAGVVLVTRPGFLFPDLPHHLDHMGVLMALAAVLCSSLAILAIRKLATTEHPTTIMVYPLLIILVAAPIIDGAAWQLHSASELFILFLAGCLMNAGQYYMTKGYSLDTAATISAVGYLEIVFAAFWGLTIFGHLPDLPTIAGSILIVGSTYALGRMRQG